MPAIDRSRCGRRRRSPERAGGVSFRPGPVPSVAHRHRRIAEDRPPEDHVRELGMVPGQVLLGLGDRLAQSHPGAGDQRCEIAVERAGRGGVEQGRGAEHGRRPAIGGEHQLVPQGVARGIDVVGVPAAPLEDHGRPAHVAQGRHVRRTEEPGEGPRGQARVADEGGQAHPGADRVEQALARPRPAERVDVGPLDAPARRQRADHRLAVLAEGRAGRRIERVGHEQRGVGVGAALVRQDLVDHGVELGAGAHRQPADREVGHAVAVDVGVERIDRGEADQRAGRRVDRRDEADRPGAQVVAVVVGVAAHQQDVLGAHVEGGVGDIVVDRLRIDHPVAVVVVDVVDVDHLDRQPLRLAIRHQRTEVVEEGRVRDHQVLRLAAVDVDHRRQLGDPGLGEGARRRDPVGRARAGAGEAHRPRGTRALGLEPGQERRAGAAHAVDDGVRRRQVRDRERGASRGEGQGPAAGGEGARIAQAVAVEVDDVVGGAGVTGQLEGQRVGAGGEHARRHLRLEGGGRAAVEAGLADLDAVDPGDHVVIRRRRPLGDAPENDRQARRAAAGLVAVGVEAEGPALGAGEGHHPGVEPGVVPGRRRAVLAVALDARHLGVGARDRRRGAGGGRDLGDPEGGVHVVGEGVDVGRRVQGVDAVAHELEVRAGAELALADQPDRDRLPVVAERHVGRRDGGEVDPGRRQVLVGHPVEAVVVDQEARRRGTPGLDRGLAGLGRQPRGVLGLDRRPVDRLGRRLRAVGLADLERAVHPGGAVRGQVLDHHPLDAGALGVEGVALGRGRVDRRRGDRLAIELLPAGSGLTVEVEAGVGGLGLGGPGEVERPALAAGGEGRHGDRRGRGVEVAGQGALVGDAGGQAVAQVARAVGPVAVGGGGDRAHRGAGVGVVVGQGAGLALADDAGGAERAVRNPDDPVAVRGAGAGGAGDVRDRALGLVEVDLVPDVGAGAAAVALRLGGVRGAAPAVSESDREVAGLAGPEARGALHAAHPQVRGGHGRVDDRAVALRLVAGNDVRFGSTGAAGAHLVDLVAPGGAGRDLDEAVAVAVVAREGERRGELHDRVVPEPVRVLVAPRVALGEEVAAAVAVDVQVGAVVRAERRELAQQVEGARPASRHAGRAERLQGLPRAGSGARPVAVRVAVGRDPQADVVARLGGGVLDRPLEEDAHRVAGVHAAVGLGAQADHHEGDVVGRAVVADAGDVVEAAAAGDDGVGRRGPGRDAGQGQQRDQCSFRGHVQSPSPSCLPPAAASECGPVPICSRICSLTVAGSRMNRSSPVSRFRI